MLVPVASCISQLKWSHFSLYPRRLVDLQLFDSASRGPWGSAVFLWNLCFRVRILVTIGFVFVTIVALGIDASAQQVLNFPIRESPLNNGSVELGVADMYYSKGFLKDTTYGGPIWQSNADLLALQASIINGATGSVFKPYFKCPAPASRCQWGIFTTLGVCTDFRDVTDVAVYNCGPQDQYGAINCTYSFPEMVDFDNLRDPMVMTWTQENEGGAGDSTMLFQSQFRASVSSNNRLGSFMAVNASKDGLPTRAHNGLAPPAVNVYSSTFEWCTQTHHNSTSSQSSINSGSMISEALTEIGGNEGNLMGTEYYTYVANSTGLYFNITEMPILSLPAYLGTLLGATVRHNIYRPDSSPESSLLEMGFALQNSDLKTVITNIGDTLTNQIRSNNPGDNNNASLIMGTAFFEEPYIHVRWGWMILPLGDVALAALLFTISTIITRKQPLLKDSVIALLVNRLDGWSGEELGVSGQQSQAKLDDLAETMLAKLKNDGQGRLRFVREQDEKKTPFNSIHWRNDCF
ncbi:hypothetical protein F5B20DRAFT_65613 [Whalleya microplaca]|nr:hypothetical protein F5B20DRAFT_65613 [Whalleya microplaca]